MKQGAFVPSLYSLDEEEKGNRSCVQHHTVAMDLNTEIQAKM
jgi:hypothetical protein